MATQLASCWCVLGQRIRRNFRTTPQRPQHNEIGIPSERYSRTAPLTTSTKLSAKRNWKPNLIGQSQTPVDNSWGRERSLTQKCTHTRQLLADLDMNIALHSLEITETIGLRISITEIGSARITNMLPTFDESLHKPRRGASSDRLPWLVMFRIESISEANLSNSNCAAILATPNAVSS